VVADRLVFIDEAKHSHASIELQLSCWTSAKVLAADMSNAIDLLHFNIQLMMALQVLCIRFDYNNFVLFMCASVSSLESSSSAWRW